VVLDESIQIQLGCLVAGSAEVQTASMQVGSNGLLVDVHQVHQGKPAAKVLFASAVAGSSGHCASQIRALGFGGWHAKDWRKSARLGHCAPHLRQGPHS
jgi:hypothetical protein